MPCRRIGLVVHQGRAAAVEGAGVVRRWAAERDIAVRDVDVWETDSRLGLRRAAVDEVSASGHPDLVVTIGGDGTFLRGARFAAVDRVPVLGVNSGRVGFLTEVEPGEITEALDAFESGRAVIEERQVLTMRASRPLEIPPDMQDMLCYGRGPLLPPPSPRPFTGVGVESGVELDVTAVNDIVFEKLARDRQASLGVYIDGEQFAAYSADALIAASPTGSTAYSFAAGGPVLSPRMRALVFTPVAPHMVFDRSLVLSPDEEVAVRVLDGSGQVAVSVDGQLRGVLDPGDWVGVYAADWPVRLVRVRPANFYSRLRQRFSLTDAPAAVADLHVRH
ncbi:NAD(+)/NADH kinase [Amycolatopsis sp. H20-H5]|uniref:NAD(+)/NADH kinase n=1 Tax=Amycolatopsis sp. H20-H5 TaxID=3046309 RepID=UPI002DB712E9|nr:NAD(+)/NADH kinase [Amycolatopsis sp. H20-H5]MEC3979670.1 NAD(+)/NADH kinase [Amycolatopsis sp. H20-H5]